jgi:Cu+-exporting ATPase
MKRTAVSLGIAALLVGAVALAAYAAGGGTGHRGKTSGGHHSAKAVAGASSHHKVTCVYVCPMHPGVKQLKPGRCPKCHMALVKRAVSAKHATHKATAKSSAVYVCPMHPDVRQGKPGTCPKCHMALVKQSK